MSTTHQDGDRAPSVANAPQQSQHGLGSESTPVKKKYGPDLAYTSAVKTFEQNNLFLGKEMSGRWLGAMPVDDFLDEFVPATNEEMPPLPDNLFQNVPNGGVESARYGPFIDAIEPWIPRLHAVNTSAREDTKNKLNLKTDVSMYNRVDGVAPPNRTDFSEMELWIEFKAKTSGAPFQDPSDTLEESRQSAIERDSFTPDTVEGIRARGQLAHYAGAQHSLQFRHFSYSIAIHGDHARLLRWDPSGTVVTAAFNYRTNPHWLVEFLWRFNHLSASQRGHDQSIQPANLPSDVDAQVREKLGVEDRNVPLYRYELPGLDGMGYAYGPRPPTQNRSLVSRCTRSLPVVWVPNEDVDENTGACSDLGTGEANAVKNGPWSDERMIYMKDTWRFLSGSPDIEVMAEHEIYGILHAHGTPNIPEHVAGGDVAGGRTRTQEFVDAPWLCVQPRISPYQHYRLVHGVVGRVLFKFECTKQLVRAVLDALEAHSHATEEAKILHRDVSFGNIILTDDGKGLLIDWELAKKLDEDGSRRPDRTGTWQFMSANLLRHPGKVHTATDDLESFLHVLAWTMLRYVPAIETYEPLDRGEDMLQFDQHSIRNGNVEHGGKIKSRAFEAERYPSENYEPKCETPLLKVVQDLSKPFKSLYGKPPTDGDRDKVNVPFNRSNQKLLRLCAAVDQYDDDMKCLASSAWFIDTMKTALDEGGWPINDKADENLQIAYPDDTEIQARNKNSQLRESQQILEMGRGVRTSSKRAASPTPESSTKRRRGTSAASGSGV